MAGFVLKVSPDELKTQAKNIENEIKEIQKDHDKILAAINSTKGYWTGEASQKHQSNYKNIDEDFTTVLKRLKEHPKDLLKMAGVYADANESAKEIAESLNEDVVI